jgi:PTS system nitrogen regulatory IIA component
MEIVDLVTPESVVANLRAASKKEALQELARLVAPLCRVEPHLVYETLLERERLGTTGTGGGTAVPHGRVAGLPRPVGFFARLEKPIDFEAIDERPVDLIFLLLTPAESGADHLKALARISRFLRDRAMCEKLRGTDRADALYALLTDRAASHAA